MASGLSKITTAAQEAAMQALKKQHWAKFNRKYEHLVVNEMPVDDLKKQADELYQQQIKNRKTLLIVDDCVYKNLPLNNLWDKVSHSAIVKSFADSVACGKICIKTINVADSEGRIQPKYVLEGLNTVMKAKKIDGLNLSFGKNIPLSELRDISKKKFTYNKSKNIIAKFYSKFNQALIAQALKHIVKLSENGIKVSIASGNKIGYFNSYALSNLLTKKAENINIVGALTQSGQKIHRYCCDKRIVTHFEDAQGYFEPVIHKYKILGFALKKQEPNEVRSVSIKPKQLDNFHEINMSNKFSGLTPEKAIARLERINKKNKASYKLIKQRNGLYLLDYSYLQKEYDTPNHYKSLKKRGIIYFQLDKNNKLVATTLKKLEKSKSALREGTSYAAPTRIANRLIEKME